MKESRFQGRKVISIENEHVRATFTAEGGHIAELFHKGTGVNPLWTPPWPSIEPSSYNPVQHPEYGQNAESKLLSGIMGHNLCLDLFGPPSEEEAKAGLTVHGEASIAGYTFEQQNASLTATCSLPLARLDFARHVHLDGPRVRIRETVRNLAAHDRPVAWQQHVTLGPPFLERGTTQFRAPVTEAWSMGSGQQFDWPWLPLADGQKRDLRVYSNAAYSGGYTAQRLDPNHEHAWALAYSPSSRLLLGYVWRVRDYPWLGMWEENHDRVQPPWNGQTMTLGLEFGTSPFPETRRDMINRGSLAGTQTFRWIPAKSAVSVEYYAALVQTPTIPEKLEQFEGLLA